MNESKHARFAYVLAAGVIVGLSVGIASMLIVIGFLNAPAIPDSALDVFEISSVSFASRSVSVYVKAVTPTRFWYVVIKNTAVSFDQSTYSFYNVSLSWNESTSLVLKFQWTYEAEYYVVVNTDRRGVSTTVVAPKKPVTAHYSVKCEVPLSDNATHADWELKFYNYAWRGEIRKLPMNVSVSLSEAWGTARATLTVTYYKEVSPGMFEQLYQKTFYVQVTVTYS